MSLTTSTDDSGTRLYITAFAELLRKPGSWWSGALCAQTDPEAFYPEKGGSTRPAKQICQGCGVKAECLEYAITHDERFGIWGGFSERERRKLKQQWRQASGPVDSAATGRR